MVKRSVSKERYFENPIFRPSCSEIKFWLAITSAFNLNLFWSGIPLLQIVLEQFNFAAVEQRHFLSIKAQHRAMALKLEVERVFCLTLRIATQIAGILSALVALVYIADLVLALSQFGQHDSSIHIDLRNTLLEIYLQICIYLLLLFSGLLLILGIHKKCHYMFVPWLAVAAFFILIGVVSIVVLIAFGVDDFANIRGLMFFLFSLGVVLLTGLGVYFWIGVFSLFRQIRDENIQEIRNPNNFERLYGSQEQARETPS